MEFGGPVGNAKGNWLMGFSARVGHCLRENFGQFSLGSELMAWSRCFSKTVIEVGLGENKHSSRVSLLFFFHGFDIFYRVLLLLGLPWRDRYGKKNKRVQRRTTLELEITDLNLCWQKFRAFSINNLLRKEAWFWILM